MILDKRCETNTLNSLGNKYLAECITSKDNTKDLIEIMAKYYLRSSFTDPQSLYTDSTALLILSANLQNNSVEQFGKPRTKFVGEPRAKLVH